MCGTFIDATTKTFESALKKLNLQGKKRGGEQERLRLFRSALCKYFAEQGFAIRNIDPLIMKVSIPDAGIVGICVLIGIRMTPTWLLK